MVGAAHTPPPSGSTRDGYAPGTVVVLRELIEGRVRSARPLRVVEDGDGALAAYLVPRSEVAWPRLLDGSQSQTPDQGWLLRREEWQGPGCLFVFPRGEAYAAVLFFDRDDGHPLSWKVDFLRPPERNGRYLDTLDWALDLLVPLDRGAPTVKDTDDLAQLRMLGLLGGDGDRLVVAARVRAERAIAGRAPPFDERWLRWRPPLDAGPSRLPPACFEAGDRDRLRAEGPSTGAPLTLRSGSGTRVLDAAGHSWLDADLDDGRLVHGHAHPAVVAAVTRQLSLGLGAEPGHLAEEALGRALCRRLRAPSLRWVASGAAALEAAASVARRFTGRVPIALWTDGAHPPPPGLVDGPLVRLDDDLGAALAQLRKAEADLAAVVVDPLELAPAAGDTDPTAGEEAAARSALVELLRTWASDTSVVVVADERRTAGVGPFGGCSRLGLTATLSLVGAGWFGGYGGGALLGPPQVVAALDATGEISDGGRPTTGPPPHPAVAAAGLASLDLLDTAALARLEARGNALRNPLGLVGLGPAFRVPPGAGGALRRAGIHCRGRWGFLATVSGDEDLARLRDALVALDDGNRS